MILTAEQLVRIVLELRERYQYVSDVDDPAVMWGLIQQTYPEVDGVSAAPSFREIRRRYIADFWENYSVPPVDLNPTPTIGPESVEARRYNEELRAAGMTPEMMAPGAQLLREVDLLASNPMAALSFITSRAMGRNREESMRVARATGAVFDLATCLVAPPVSDVSGEITHGTPRVESSRRRPPDPYSPAEISARLARGYHGAN